MLGRQSLMEGNNGGKSQNQSKYNGAKGKLKLTPAEYVDKKRKDM